MVDRLARALPVRLLVVGTGPGEREVAELGEAVNAASGVKVVHVAGQMIDPRAAYDLADVVIGMGGSALKGLAFGKPLIVLGGDGFARLVDENSIPLFLHQGWYGVGDCGEESLEENLTSLLHDPALRSHLGRIGRELIEARFSLEGAVDRQIDMYRAALTEPLPARSRYQGMAAAKSRVGEVQSGDKRSTTLQIDRREILWIWCEFCRSGVRRWRQLGTNFTPSRENVPYLR